MQDEDVKNYFETKAAALHKALDTGYAPKCNDEETWSGRRCAGWCDVAKACQTMNNLK
ncbi:unnamed protein product [marine sediment metagenome]|uniref:PD-(D/E)XK endonuclease-like domain-containing protein n=1 Tax=marine sediment metagenome TaxID=412755 RepID=X1D9G5_9ZZZZ